MQLCSRVCLSLMSYSLSSSPFYSLSLKTPNLISEREKDDKNKMAYSVMSVIRPGSWDQNVKTFVIRKPFCSQIYDHGHQNSVLKLSTEH